MYQDGRGLKRGDYGTGSFGEPWNHGTIEPDSGLLGSNGSLVLWLPWVGEQNELAAGSTLS
jgi:hypothetical protein